MKMQSNKVDQIITRLNEFRSAGFDMSLDAAARKTKTWVDMQRDERKVSEIINAVASGRSASSRLATAEKTLAKWGF